METLGNRSVDLSTPHALETSLVEWKQQARGHGAGETPALETSLVEWKLVPAPALARKLRPWKLP